MSAAWIWLQEIVQGISIKGKLLLLKHFSEPEMILNSDFSSGYQSHDPSGSKV